MAELKQWRVVYEYRHENIRGAGAAFVIATDEAQVRRQLELKMPGVTPLTVVEEPVDPAAIYERWPRVAVRAEIICAEPPANEDTEPKPVEW